MNLAGPELVRDLVSLIQRAEADDTVQVLVLKSADPDYFISHVDVTRIKSFFALYHGTWPVNSGETSGLSPVQTRSELFWINDPVRQTQIYLRTHYRDFRPPKDARYTSARRSLGLETWSHIRVTK